MQIVLVESQGITRSLNKLAGGENGPMLNIFITELGLHLLRITQFNLLNWFAY